MPVRRGDGCSFYPSEKGEEKALMIRRRQSRESKGNIFLLVSHRKQAVDASSGPLRLNSWAAVAVRGQPARTRRISHRWPYLSPHSLCAMNATEFSHRCWCGLCHWQQCDQIGGEGRRREHDRCYRSERVAEANTAVDDVAGARSADVGMPIEVEAAANYVPPPPIVIHPEEVEYFVTGKMVQVIKKADS